MWKEGKTPLPLRGISPKGEKILIHLVESHLRADFSPPGRGSARRMTGEGVYLLDPVNIII